MESENAERMLVGLAIGRPCTTVAVDLEGRDFRAYRLGILWDLVARLYREGRIPGDDFATEAVALAVRADERARRDLEGFSWDRLPEEVPSLETNPEYYASQIRENQAARELDVRLSEIRERRKEGARPEDLADELDELATFARKGGARVSLDLDAPRVGAMLEGVRNDLVARARGEARPFPLPEKWRETARELGGGLWPGWSYVLVGSTGAGKSQWALQVALEVARKENPVLYIGLELDRAGLVARLLGLMARRKWSTLYMGEEEAPGYGEHLGDATKRLFDTHGPELEALPLHLEVGPPFGWDYTRLYPLALALKRHYQRPPLVILDYLQLVTSPKGAREDVRERVGKVAYEARRVARDAGAAVLVLSSVARANYAALTGGKGKKGDNQPEPAGTGDPGRFVGMGKESGETEYAADAVLALARERWDEEGSPLWLALAKRRARPSGAKSGWVQYEFNGGWFDETGKVKADPSPLKALAEGPALKSDRFTG